IKGGFFMSYQRQYEKKRMTPEEAVALIKPGDDIITPILVAEPPALMKALENHRHLNENRLFQMFTTRDVISHDPDRLKITSMFMGASERKAFKEGKIDLLPNHFSDIPKLLAEHTNQRVAM